MALTQLFSNQANTTLAGAITNTSLTANLAPGSGVLFPSPGVGQYFTMIFNDVATNLSYEEVWVTNVTGDTITMMRGQEGSTAKAWEAGDIAFNGMTAGTANSFSQIAAAQNNAFNYGIDTGSANAYILSLTPAVTEFTEGMPIWFKVKTTNTGASVLTLNGLAATPLIGLAESPLQGSELIANGTALAIYNTAAASFVLAFCTDGASQVANATKPMHAVNQAYGDARYAALAGLVTQVFSVAPATAAGHAAQAGQVVSGSLGTATAGGTANAITASFPAAPTAYVSGQPFTIISAATNTGAMTAILTLGGTAQASVAIVKANNQPVVAGDYPVGYPGEFAYSTAFGALVMNNPATGISASSAPPVVGSTRNAKMSITTAAAAGTFTADEVVVESALGGTAFKLASFSQALNLATTGAGGMDAGTAPVSGFVALYASCKAGGTVPGIFACNVTTSNGSVYTGANVPAGVVATALIGIWPTNASSQFVPGLIQDPAGRKFQYRTYPVVLSNATLTSTLTTQSVSGSVPAGTKAASFLMGSQNASVSYTFAIAADATGTGGRTLNIASTTGSNFSIGGAANLAAGGTLYDVPLVTAQTVFMAANTVQMFVYTQDYSW